MVIKLVEQYSVNQLRGLIRDSLQYHGEQCVLLQMYHIESGLAQDNPFRCPDCFDDVYESNDRADCDLCYGTTFYGGVRQASLVWGMFTDKIIAEQYGKQGTWTPDKREFQCEPFPELMEHDYVVRVRLWDKTNTIPLEIEGYYGIAQVTRDSVRTGSRFGQWQWDVVGQRAQISELQHNSAIVQYPVVGVTFSQPVPPPEPASPMVEGAPNVVFVQVGPGGIGKGNTTVVNFIQSLPKQVWTIPHSLQSPAPEVNIVVNGEKVEAPVTYPDPHTVVITFAQPESGTAELIG